MDIQTCKYKCKSRCYLKHKHKYDHEYKHKRRHENKQINYVNRYSWIAFSVDAHKKLIWQRTERATINPRPPLKSSRRGEFRSEWSIFV